MINFDAVVGQEKPIQILKNLIRFGRIGHAYLFTGPEGTGRKTVAISFAKAVNCLNLPEKYDPCNYCSNCLKTEKGIHSDFHTISPLNSVITIEQIREIKETIYWRPLENRKKIFIISDAHKMTLAASNSLLKILEEPPSYAVLILITSVPENLLPTILSRCHRISFQPLKKAEQKEISNRMGRGSEEKNKYIDWVLKAKSEQPFSYFFSTGEKEIKDITDSFLDFTEVMILWFRDILFLQLGLPQNTLSFPERIDKIKDFAQFYSEERIIAILDYLTQIPEKMEKYINPKILLENFILQIGD
ncbi:MAG: DNA polymerase III subunit delta' [Candidatus Atribacteria bacterium]|nr:DNA polymerase III subunit delta' [Candidatus Atribacteria bacterium]